MSGRGTDPSIEDYPSQKEDARLVGIDVTDTPIYYDPVAHIMFEGETDPNEIVPDWADREQLSPEVDIGDVIEEVGDTVGWQALSEYGEQYQED